MFLSPVFWGKKTLFKWGTDSSNFNQEVLMGAVPPGIWNPHCLTLTGGQRPQSLSSRSLLLSEPYTLSKAWICDQNWANLSVPLGFPKQALGEGQIEKDEKSPWSQSCLSPHLHQHAESQWESETRREKWKQEGEREIPEESHSLFPRDLTLSDGWLCEPLHLSLSPR